MCVGLAMMGEKANKSGALTLERQRIRRAQSGCLRSRDELMLSALPAIRTLVSRRYAESSQFHEDLVQECVLALPAIVDRYDLSHPACVRLMTFAYRHLLGACSQCLRRLNPERESVLAEPADVLGCTSTDDSPEEPAERRGRIEDVRSALDTLDPRARAIVCLRARQDPVPLRVLASNYDISRTRVFEIQRSAMGQLAKTIAQ